MNEDERRAALQARIDAGHGGAKVAGYTGGTLQIWRALARARRVRAGEAETVQGREQWLARSRAAAATARMGRG